MVRATTLALMILLAACGGDEFAAEKEAVASMMRDPGSVQFRDVDRCPYNESAIRGEVNGKNLYGAYTGFTAFFFVNGSASFAGDGARFEAMMGECYGPKMMESIDLMTD